MNMQSSVSGRMEYIQKLFLDVEAHVETLTDLKEIIDFLEKEPPEFRSVAYESASFVIGQKDLKTLPLLDRWIDFKQASASQHTFHIDIGLGWAFAKTSLYPGPYLSAMQSLARWMVFDGMGYYYGLFKGRNTLKNKSIPEGMEGDHLHAFDQGLGRRLWYISKGNINEVGDLVESFPEPRHPDLFRGIGIACGYVGGNKEDDLKRLSDLSGKHYKQLQIGTLLATISRIASNSVNADIGRACEIICKKTVDELKVPKSKVSTNFFYLYITGNTNHWLTLLESQLMQTN